MGTLDQERNLFVFFFRAPCILRTTGIFGYNRSLRLCADQNTGTFAWSMFQPVGDDMKMDRISRRRSNGVLQHNTWCLGTSCGGINPYTLTARFGPARIRGFGPLDDDARSGQFVQNPAQGIKADLEVKRDPGRLE